MAMAIDVLRSAGLAERLDELGVADRGDMQLQGPSGERGPSGLLNEHALTRLVEATRDTVTETRVRERKPLLVGGDCPVILGALSAISEEEQQHGLVMIDGHEDAWPPPLSDTGE